jgi:di/tricarboxylate transporter
LKGGNVFVKIWRLSLYSAESATNVMDMSTHSAAESLDGVAEVLVSRAATVAQEDRVGTTTAEQDVTTVLRSEDDVPMKFVRVGLPATIFLWAVLALVGYMLYRLIG